MQSKSKVISIIITTGVLLISCSIFKSNRSPEYRFRGKTQASDSVSKNSDSSVAGKIKPYKTVITSKALTDSGLLIVHKINGRFLFEISDSLLNRDILVVSRIAKAAANVKNESAGYAGDEINENIVRFERGINSKLFIRGVSYESRSLDSSDNGLYRNINNSNYFPILAAFEIKTYGIDSSIVIDVTDWLSGDNNVLFFNPFVKKRASLGGLIKDKSFVQDIKSFPLNVEVETINTYSSPMEEVATFQLNASMMLLPKEVMRPRNFDARVGYFSTQALDYDNPNGVSLCSMITRWNLQPKPEDREKYLRGELVEPEKPIVYYIDPTTPKKWVPYLIEGVNDWQKAFEKAGFKNAIYALEAPKNDPQWSLFDARHNAIVYKSSLISNASGPNVHDPRSGEILESHINWYHNIIQLLHDWYMVQAGPNDPRARKLTFDDELMGRLVRYVVCHEVGHTLGLAHNFGASSTIPVDSLRSKSYVQKNGFCPSIMDYARFNYVAQPSDSFPEKLLLPQIGIYDEWAIEWGYKWLPELQTIDDEKIYMDKWITKRLSADKRLWYGKQDDYAVIDPRCQAEDLGDDAMKAGYYGIQNLKRVMSNIIPWTKESGTDYDALRRVTKLVINQYSQYACHVVANIGRYTYTPMSPIQGNSVYGFIPKEKQKEAVRFLQEQVFKTPSWLMDKNITLLIGGEGTNLSASLQSSVLNYLFSLYANQVTPSYLYGRMTLINEMLPEEKRYTFNELLFDLEDGIFQELVTGTPVDFNRRRLQKMYIEELMQMNNLADMETLSTYFVLTTDFLSIVKGHMRHILREINFCYDRTKDMDTKLHLSLLKSRLEKALKLKPELNETAHNTIKNLGSRMKDGILMPPDFKSENKNNFNCWNIMNPLTDLEFSSDLK